MTDDEGEDFLDGGGGNLQNIGKQNPMLNKPRFGLVLENSLVGINRLSRGNLQDYATRNSFKSSLLSLESLLRPYWDEPFLVERGKIASAPVGSSADEIIKAHRLYALLMELVGRCELLPPTKKLYKTFEGD
jgi:hypothetical protein